jgi:enediyne biosynthesis protein E4
MSRSGLLLSLWMSTAGTTALDRAALQAKQAEAVVSVNAASTAQEVSALADVGARLQALGDADLLSAELRQELKEAAAALRIQAKARPMPPYAAAPHLELLERVRTALAAPPMGLDFQGSYTQTKVTEPVYGGHASAMGPPPIAATAATALAPSPVTFVERPAIPVKTFCGGRTKDHILESGGTGLALFDYDDDGRLDVYLVNAPELTDDRTRVPHRNALFRNLGDWKFEDVSSKAGVDRAAWGNGVCAGDYDDDGRLDLYVTNFGANLLFRNNGDGTFAERAAGAGVSAGGWSTGCTFFDADADGDLDLYVAAYVKTSNDELVKAQRTLTWRGGPTVMIGPIGLPGEADLFFENRGDGTFTETSAARGLADTARAFGFGVLATDYDDDARVDLFVANDTNPNFLFHNLGDGRFDSVGLLSGVALNADGRAQAGMGVDAGDYDGDGRLDLIVTNFAYDYNTLYRNLGGGQFEDASKAAGLDAATFVRMGWGTQFFDADADGDLDLFFANGHIYPNVDEFPALGETFAQANQLFLNDGGRFHDVSETAGPGLAMRRVSRGLAIGDLDGDGDPDIAIGNMGEAPTLLENRGVAGRHWIALRLSKASPNRFAIGARVTITAGGRKQMREVRSGGSYLSQSELTARFGLGEHAGPVNVEVRLPGGTRWRWTGIASDREHRLTLSDAQRVKE